MESASAATDATQPVEALWGHPVTAKSLWRDAALDLLGTLVSGLALAFPALIAVYFASGLDDPKLIGESSWGNLVLLLASQLPYLYFAPRRRRRNRDKQRPVMALFSGATGPAIRSGMAAGFTLAVVSLLYTLAIARLLGEAAVENRLGFLQGMLGDPWWATALVGIIAILAPIGEEWFFRGAIFGSAHAAGFSTLGAVISAVTFALVHLSLPMAPFYAIFAVVMCWLYARTGTLAAPIAAHMTLNGIACAAFLIASKNTV